MFSHKQDSELNDLIEGFQMFASDNGGLVNPNELKEIMETMNMDEKNPFIYNTILDLCSNPEIQEKGGIEAADFISLLDQGINDTSTRDGVHNLFSIFSNTSTNTVPLQIFSQIAGDDNSMDGSEDIKKLISKPEINGKELDFDEFHDIVKTETPKQSPNEKPLYIKKSSAREGYSNNVKNKSNNKRNNDDTSNNNNDFNNINNMGSKNSSERNSSRYSYQNKRSPNIEENNNSNYKYTKVITKKSFPSNSNNNEMNNLDDINQNNEGDIKRKVYRHKRGSKQNDEIDNNYKEEIIENIKNIEENNSGEKSDRAERRYHRRYRVTKPSYKK
jgi:Ca2+-binding EF-hand superfamily protein